MNDKRVISDDLTTQLKAAHANARAFAQQNLAMTRSMTREFDEIAKQAVEHRRQREASGIAEHLVAWLRHRIEALKNTEDIGIPLASGGHLVLEGACEWGPALILLWGHTTDGKPAEVLQHITQLNVTIVVLPRNPLAGDRAPFGFQPPSSMHSSGSGE